MSLTDKFNHSDQLKLSASPLNPKFPSSSSSLSHLSDSLSLLSKTISTFPLPSDSSSRDAYFNSTVSILDKCNSISAQIERLRLARLKIKLALQLLSSHDTKSINKAGKILFELDMSVCDESFGLGSVDEWKKVKKAVESLREEIERGERGEKIKREMESAVEELMVGLDCLARAVNELFSVVLSSRNDLLDSYRLGPKRCK